MIDLEQKMRELSKKEVLYDEHWTVLGNERAAEELTKFLIEERVV